MSIPSLAVRRPIGTIMIYVAVVVLGFVAMGRLPIDLMPSVQVPRVSITTLYEGVAPAEIETLITRPIEQAVSTIAGVDELHATSSEGISSVTLRFAWGTDLEVAVADIRAQLDRVAARLPEDADRPSVYKFDLSSFPVAQLGVSGGGDPRRLRYLAEEVLSRRLERVQGVAAVQVQGGRVREIQVLLSPQRLTALGLAARDVVDALRRENRNVSGGDLLADGREVVVRTLGEFESVDQVEQIVVAVRGDRPVYVRDIGQVVDSFQEQRSELWINGSPGISLRVSKQDGANTVQVVRAVRAEVEELNREYEGILRLDFLADHSVFIQQAIGNVTSSAVGGAVLAVVVLLAFLRDVRATLVVGLSIPISILATFALMDLGGISLNTVSFGGLALGIGMLVDNAIVLVENIYRHREEGAVPLEAAVRGSEEVVGAITASTLTTLAVFVPVVFISGFAGIFFREMAIVVSFALVCSLAVAVSLVPTVSGRLLRAQGQSSNGGEWWLERAYGRGVERIVRHPWLTLSAAMALLVVSMGLGNLVSFELMPETDEGEIDIDVELPIGTPVETTMRVMRELEARVVSAIPPEELATYTTTAGPSRWWRPAGGNVGEVELQLVPVSQRSRGVDAVMADVRQATAGIPGATIRVRKSSSNMLLRMMRGGRDDRMSVAIRGHDLVQSAALANEVAARLQDTPGVSFVQIAQEKPQVERRVRIDRDRVAQLGLRGTDVAEAVETYLIGRVATRYRDAGGEYDVRVRLNADDSARLDQLMSLPVIAPDGRMVPISQIASVEEGMGPSAISRENQERVQRVNIGLDGTRPLGDVVGDLGARLDRIAIPDGFTVELGGEAMEQQDTFRALMLGLLLALFLVYAVMAVQFESLRDPFVVMGSVPFAGIGVVLALLLTGTTFNMNSFLGTIVLVGIVVNNAIVMVETANQWHERGLTRHDAIVRASTRRLRPILMTTLTTVLGMVPLALGLGEGSELQAPLARVVIGGLLTSTMVTLAVVPSLYLLVRWRTVQAEAPATLPMTEATG